MWISLLAKSTPIEQDKDQNKSRARRHVQMTLRPVIRIKPIIHFRAPDLMLVESKASHQATSGSDLGRNARRLP